MVRGAIAAWAALLTVSAASAQVPAPPLSEVVATQIRPHSNAYEECARRHLRATAARSAALAFDAVEISIRPACGHHLETVLNLSLANGFTRESVAVAIREFYNRIRPGLVTLYDAERAQVASQYAEQERLQREGVERAERQKRDNENRAAILAGLRQDYVRCLRRELSELLPYSDEGAETLATVVIAKCREVEQKQVSYAATLYGMPEDDLRPIITDATAKWRTEVLTQIVEIRAAAKKALIDGEPSRGRPSIGTPAKSY